MIVCPNCNHQNPDGSSHCEACFTPLPSTCACPNCGASVQADATFCGQCGTGLKPSSPLSSGLPDLPDFPSLPDFPDYPLPGETLVVNPGSPPPSPSYSGSSLPATVVNSPDPVSPPMPDPAPPMPDPIPPPMPDPVSPPMPDPVSPPMPDPVPLPIPDPVPPMPDPGAVTIPDPVPPPMPVMPTSGMASTQLQLQSAKLLHLQTNQLLELPLNLSVIHIGKPNDQVPPDIDVSGFPNSEIVSRIHSDIRVEGDAYYIEDVGSSNGTYINHNVLAKGNRHKLRPGDRISLGKGDLVTFLFQSS
ncbi:FHA domain-containing protein [Merismopedia glauca]|uniref:Peptide-binding protein n=1 Tax=Merismopedia glauca CCAP 1448/3 TaxID=1296344 RepID=A0A2T1C0N3_9CYAN|nr:FHA domain-containing protein [Merismopedia glauca]PSB01802.1 peptide-binding protein [Merismopedia glauca CCAP 1448/3]